MPGDFGTMFTGLFVDAVGPPANNSADEGHGGHGQEVMGKRSWWSWARGHGQEVMVVIGHGGHRSKRHNRIK